MQRIYIGKYTIPILTQDMHYHVAFTLCLFISVVLCSSLADLRIVCYSNHIALLVNDSDWMSHILLIKMLLQIYIIKTLIPRYNVMKWIVYIFVLAVSFGLLKRGRADWIGYMTWVVMAVVLGLGLIFL